MTTISTALSWVKGKCVDCKKKEEKESGKGGKAEEMVEREVKASIYMGDVFLIINRINK